MPTVPAEGWTLTLDLAWASYRAGTTPVGAVVLAPDGTVVAAGRGRRYERKPEAGQLSHCHIAHAEVNALAQLPPERHYLEHTLLTSLEPCCMCVGAAVQATLTTIRYAGRDPYGGASHLRIDTPQARRRPLRSTGPEPGTVGLVAETLHIAWLARAAAGPPLEAQRPLGRAFELGTDREVIDSLRKLAESGAPTGDVCAVVEAAAAG